MNPAAWPQLSWSTLLLALWAAVGLYAAGHALITRTDPRTAWGWIAVCWLFPFAGPALYFIFGINRIRTRAHRLGMERRALGLAADGDVRSRGTPVAAIPIWLEEVARTADRLTQAPLLAGNRLQMLCDGEQAYPRMLAAIDSAERSIAVASYIFDADALGRQFVDALARAKSRGVDVRILVDGIGLHYSLVSIVRLLRRRDIETAVFNPLRLLPPALHLNLRNHRKLLLVDGRIGYTGGINLSARHLTQGTNNRRPVADLHFEVQGPVLGQLAASFGELWGFAGGSSWSPPPAPPAVDNGAICRVIIDGPNEDIDHLSMVLQSAISAARRRVLIMTPYFLPPNEMIAELRAAALRGVRVEVVLPARNNLPFVHWATRNMLGELLRYGVHVHYQPPPFCHSKLFVVDDAYAQIGSANLDPRSLKLNFELAVEVYDAAFARQLAAHFEQARDRGREVGADELLQRSLPVRLRDAFFWLFSPYL